MTRVRKTYVVLALLAVLATWGAGVGPSSAQEHHGDHGHGGHGSTTTGPTTTAPPTTGPSTTRPSTTTTRPPSTTTTTPAPGPGEQRAKIRYGPFTIPGAPDNPDGSHGHTHTGNRFSLNVQKPCTNCYITGIQPDLVYADGRQAGFSTRAQLHHMVLFNRDAGRTDATCGSSMLGLLGQRFFASGDEREPAELPNGFGYKIGPSSQWNLIWDLAGMSPDDQQVYFELTYDFAPATATGITDVEPIWLDINQCGTSTYSAPAGESERTYTWTVNRPGRLVGIGGHQHDGGTHLSIVNDSTGQMICDSRATYGGSPLYIDHHGEEHLSSMSSCEGTAAQPVTTLANGQRVTIHSYYDLPEAKDDVMGIAIGYIAQGSGGVTPPPQDDCPWWWPPCWFNQMRPGQQPARRP
jgi:hypothetical protein